VLIAACAVALTAGCAAGQDAQTAEEVPSLDGTQGQVGAMILNAVALRTPSGSSWAPGASVSLTAHITNNGRATDSLKSVSSPEFSKGWTVVPFAQNVTTGSSQPAPQRIGAGNAIGYGFENLNSDGAHSANAIYLRGLTSRLWPGSSVKVTFTFASAGSTTLTVPVQLSDEPGAPPPPYTPSTAAE
jgi:periplasmic copper chaperone A